jgi:hypothetical protein
MATNSGCTDSGQERAALLAQSGPALADATRGDAHPSQSMCSLPFVCAARPRRRIPQVEVDVRTLSRASNKSCAVLDAHRGVRFPGHRSTAPRSESLRAQTDRGAAEIASTGG